MNDLEKQKQLDILFGLISDDLEHWEKRDWFWFEGEPTDDNEAVAYDAMKSRWNGYANEIIASQVRAALEEVKKEFEGADEISEEEALGIIDEAAKEWGEG